MNGESNRSRGPSTAVSVDLVFEEGQEATIPELIRGGLNFEIDGQHMLRYEDVEGSEWRPRGPEYLGEHIILDVAHLLTAVTQVLDGTVDRYETAAARIASTREEIVFERLSDERLRIALRLWPQRDGESELRPIAEAERGYVVDAREFGWAVLECGREFQSYMAEQGFGPDEDIADKIEDLEEALEQSTG